MAEILGAVASGLAVAEVGLKVGGTVWKLKKLWQQVHEVPETIRDLIRQIEIMDPILSDHETSLGIQGTALLRQVPTCNSAPATQSAKYCREALGDLQRLMEDLDVAIESEKTSRRTLARMRVVLKKDTIKGFQERLERAIKLLQWTQFNYLAANTTVMGSMVSDVWTAVADMQSHQQLLIQQLSNNNSSSSTGLLPFPIVSPHVDPSQDRALNSQKRIQLPENSVHISWSKPSVFGALVVGKSETKATGEATYAARLQLPKWLSRKVWDISISRACLGWQGTLSIWNVIPDDSPGMLCVENGDLDGLIDLFNRGLASPRDCNIDGETIFYMACRRSQTHIIQYFFNMNLQEPYITAMNEYSKLCTLTADLPLDVLQQVVSRGFCNNIANATEDFELLNEPVERNSVNSFSIACLLLAWNWLKKLEVLFPVYLPFWGNLPPTRKREILMLMPFEFRFFGGHQFWTANLFRLILCPDGPVRKINVQAYMEDGVSLLHQAFYCYINSSSRGLDSGWQTLLEEVIKATDDLHRRVEFAYPRLQRLDADTFAFRAPYIDIRSALETALVSVLRGLLRPKRLCIEKNANIRRLLKEKMAKLQSMISILASCGYDLLEFGRQEAVIWGNEDDTNSITGDTLYLGIGDYQDGLPFVKALHYGAEPWDWYFEMDFHYENYAGDFWDFLENPHLFMMPGAWIDDEWDSNWA